MYEDETDEKVKALWGRHLLDEIAHLHKAAELLKTYENKEWQQVIPDGKFPKLISFNQNIENNKAYIRATLKNTVDNAAIMEDYTTVDELPQSYQFFKYNDCVNGETAQVPSHKVIREYIAECGEDYRFEETPHPVVELRDRTTDNTEIGR
jgi:hypothetical protein